MNKGKLFLVPSYLSSGNDVGFLSPMVIDIIKNCDVYFVENIRSARRFISSLKCNIHIESLHFYELNKNSKWDDLFPIFEPLRNGSDAAVISEAGLPCLADPGNLAVSFAHQTGIQVIPLPGTSSIQMALISSGFNGQQFTFHGYLPIEKSQRIKKIRELEKNSLHGYTQLFMETPYRNQQLLKDIMSTCKADTMLSVAADISGAREMISTQSIRNWRDQKTDLHKIPAIFSFGQIT